MGPQRFSLCFQIWEGAGATLHFFFLLSIISIKISLQCSKFQCSINVNRKCVWQQCNPIFRCKECTIGALIETIEININNWNVDSPSFLKRRCKPTFGGKKSVVQQKFEFV
uniref:Uncharacterized protein n=1 Tax=Cacopsylla melanoneura TaxID=428564 RepID=A0A8D8LAP1_9HEMI